MRDIVFLINKKLLFVLLSFIKMVMYLGLLGGLFLFIQSSDYFVKKLHEKEAIYIVLKEDITTDQLSYIEFKLRKNQWIDRIQYISPDFTDSIFLKNTGEDVKNILGYSPVPGCFLIKLKSTPISVNVVESIFGEIKEYPGILEIVYEKEFGKIMYEILPRAVEYLKYILCGFGLLGLFVVFGLAKETLILINENRKKKLGQGAKTIRGRQSAAFFISGLIVLSAIINLGLLRLFELMGMLKLDVVVTNWVYIQLLYSFFCIVILFLIIPYIFFLNLPKNNN